MPLKKLEIDTDKFALGLATIFRPVKYDALNQYIIDKNNQIILDVLRWPHLLLLSIPDERQDNIGELLVEIINQL